MKPPLFTIGHSNHEWSHFLSLLQMHGISAVADVRSSPYSRRCPHFHRENLASMLVDHQIRYVFLGHELGARRTERECYVNGKADYDRIACTDAFQSGIERVRVGRKNYRIALMCSEKDPLMCHRSILVCRHLRGEDGPICHILDNGVLETHSELESRLLSLCNLPEVDLFRSRDELVETAYALQGGRIAYVEASAESEDLS
jgi:uncharacterized protein (DUF488 family)